MFSQPATLIKEGRGFFILFFDGLSEIKRKLKNGRG